MLRRVWQDSPRALAKPDVYQGICGWVQALTQLYKTHFSRWDPGVASENVSPQGLELQLQEARVAQSLAPG